MYYTYIIKCEKGTLYTGITTDVERRFGEHKSQNRLGAKYTRSHKVESVEAIWSSQSRSTASKLEFFIKSLSRDKKIELINNPKLLIEKYGDKLFDIEYVYCNGLIDALKV
ncbi:MAG: GIY-YIG nuclease family protein [Ruminococcaceae bacterium]|nr:GIY-YIG nuclease family protein [Oscillospiraceae bacterium]